MLYSYTVNITACSDITFMAYVLYYSNWLKEAAANLKSNNNISGALHESGFCTENAQCRNNFSQQKICIVTIIITYITCSSSAWDMFALSGCGQLPSLATDSFNADVQCSIWSNSNALCWTLRDALPFCIASKRLVHVSRPFCTDTRPSMTPVTVSQHSCRLLFGRFSTLCLLTVLSFGDLQQCCSAMNSFHNTVTKRQHTAQDY